MALRGIFHVTRQTRILLVILVCLAVSGFIIAYFYYSFQSRSEDPRVQHARQKLTEYDRAIGVSDYSLALKILDEVELIYLKTPGYAGSYELGVICNNKGSVYLSMAIYDSLIAPEEKTHLLQQAEVNLLESIRYYQTWIDSAGMLSREQIRSRISSSFNDNDVQLKGKNINRMIKKRVDDIVNAQTETPRRLSVSFTNLGIVQRHQYKQDEAAASYIEAIKLWKDNFTARNNFNVLMGYPPNDRSIIEKLFPPERLKKD